MNKKQKSQSRHAFWEDHINHWQGSGLNQAEYCRRNDLGSCSFSSWKNRIIREKSKSDAIAERRCAQPRRYDERSALVELPLSTISDSNGKALFEFSISEGGLNIKISPALLDRAGRQ